MEKVKEIHNSYDWVSGVNEPTTDDILLKAMNLIYGEV
jgi:hypothetical protein